MATQIQSQTRTLADRTELRLKASQDEKPYGQKSYIDTAIERTGTTINWAATNAKATLDKVVPPEQSSAAMERTQQFAQGNPKLAAFLLINIILSGVPLLLFAAFSVSILSFSLVTGIILGLVGAFMFTSSIVGVALLFVVPTILFTTFLACTLFFWAGLALYIYTQVDRRRQT